MNLVKVYLNLLPSSNSIEGDAMLKLFKRKKAINVSVINEIYEIKNGDDMLRNTFIEKYMPFIISTASKVTRTYIDVNNSEELSIALEAFNEAINRYEDKKGTFFKFAELVIRNRIIDYQRKVFQSPQIVSTDEDYHQVEDPLDFVQNISFKGEILEFKDKLNEFGIPFSKLIEDTPKHRDTRSKIINLSRNIVSTPILLKTFYDNKRLPRNLISKKFDVSIKVITSNRTYIIACILILDSSWDHIKVYLMDKGGEYVDV